MNLQTFDEEYGAEQDRQMDKAEYEACEQWRDFETNTRIRRSDNTINKGD